MKKFCVFLLCICWFSISVIAHAVSCAVTATETLVLKEGETEVVLPITVSINEPYAGAEFALRCGSGVTVKSVSYSSKNVAAAAPTQAGGYIWFSYFDGENSFKEDITASVVLEYNGEENTEVILYSVSLYTKAGAAVEKETLALEKHIRLQRDSSPSVSETEKTEAEVTENVSQNSAEPETDLSNTTAPAEEITTVPESIAVTTADSESMTTTKSANSIPNTGDSSGHMVAIAGICFGAALFFVVGYVIYCKTKGLKKEG